MKIYLYNVSKRTNSTKTPTGAGDELEVRLLESTSIRNPSFIITSEEYPNYNYVGAFGRYYYIEDIQSRTKNTWQIICSLDALATFKSDILSTEAFVEYSTSEYKEFLADTRISTTDVNDTVISVYDTPAGIDTLCTYFIRVINDTGGFSSLYAMSYGNFNGLASWLVSNQDWITELQQMLNNPFDAIIEAYRLPVSYSYLSGTEELVKIGTTFSNNFGKKLSTTSHGVTETHTIPYTANDYRETPPYMSLSLHFSFAGLFNLDTALLVENGTFTTRYAIDYESGDMIIEIRNGSVPIQRQELNCKYPIAVSQIQSKAKEIVSGTGAIAGGLVASAMSGGIGAVAVVGAMGIAGSSAINERRYGTTGSNAGSANLLFDSRVILYMNYKQRTDEPDNYTDFMGRPLKAVRTIGDLSGYVQTSGASVQADTSSEIIDTINSALNGGIYLE